jgi:ABC-type phosphate/phosphonate transport system substrate-binding protein
MRNLSRLLIASLCLLAVIVSETAAQDKPTLRFSGIPNQNTTELAEKYRPLGEHHTAQLGVKVE